MTASSWPQERQQAVALLESTMNRYVIHNYRFRQAIWRGEVKDAVIR